MYELCKVTVDVFGRGATLWNTGPMTRHILLADQNKSMLLCSIPTEEPFVWTKEHKCVFRERCTFLFVDIIGMDDRSRCPGRMEQLLKNTHLKDVWGEMTVEKVLAFADTITKRWYFPKSSHVTFIGLFEEDEQDHTWNFVGELPVDERLRSIVVSTVRREGGLIFK